MNVFVNEIVTPAAHLPITTSDPDLAAAVVEELERVVLWRAIVRQTRRILIDGPLPIVEIEPVVSITSLTRWTSTDPAEVVDPASYTLVSRDPAGALIAPSPGYSFPAPERPFGSFSLTYECGWEVSPESSPGANDAINRVPPSILFMIDRAIKFRAVSGGVGDIKVGSLDLSVPGSYATDRIPPEISSIGKTYAYRPGLFSGRP